MSNARKEAARREDIARQTEQAQQILDQALAQLVPGSEEYNQLQLQGGNLVSSVNQGTPWHPEDLRAFAAQFVTQQQQRIAHGEPATPLEARTQAAFGGLRKAAEAVPFEQDALNALLGLPTTTPSGQIFRQTVSRAASPRFDDAVFKNALKLVEDRVNQEYAGRGLLGGGLRLEGLGRAGVEAAIAEAQRQDTLRQQAFENFGSVFDTGEMLRNRGIGIENALVNLQLGRESNLTGLLNQNANLRLNDLVHLLERQTGQATADRLDAQAKADASRAATGQAVGTGLGALAFAVPGLQPFAPALMAAGGQIGSGLAGGGGTPSNASQYLAGQRAATSLGTAPPVSLSRAIELQSNPRTSSTENARYIDELLRRIGNG